MNIETFWQTAAQRLQSGTPLFASLVVANTHGSPGTLGARLLVDAHGDIAGTIGGGIMEARLIEEAHRRLREATDTKPELRLLVHRKDGTEHPSGLICAGEQTVVNVTLEPKRHGATVRRFSGAVIAQGGPAVTLTIDADGLRLTDEADSADIEPGMSLIETQSHWSYRESSINPKRMAIVGGGHCGKALASLAVQIGYHVDVFDDRAGVLASGQWPRQARLHELTDYGDLNAQLHYPALTTVVVMTASVLHDIAALTSVAATPLHWLGVMGSAAKIHEIRTQLAARGIAQDRIDAIHGPIGLPMKSDKPAEIAVSVMAQLLVEQTPEPRSGASSRARRRRAG